jgi:hypothetical protein
VFEDARAANRLGGWVECGRAVDFKVQPIRAFDAYAGARVRLDCAFMPEESIK